LKGKHIPERTCIGCGTKQSKYAMWRIVFHAPDRIVLDRKYREPGRGAYLCPKRDCLENALKRRALHRAYRTQVPAACYEQLKEAFYEALKENTVDAR